MTEVVYLSCGQIRMQRGSILRYLLMRARKHSNHQQEGIAGRGLYSVVGRLWISVPLSSPLRSGSMTSGDHRYRTGFSRAAAVSGSKRARRCKDIYPTVMDIGKMWFLERALCSGAVGVLSPLLSGFYPVSSQPQFHSSSGHAPSDPNLRYLVQDR